MLNATYASNSTQTQPLIFTVNGGIQYGQFENVNNAGTPITQFSNPLVISGDIQFVHDGGEIAPYYEISVSEGACSSEPMPAIISFSHVNDMPQLINNQLTINENETILISQNILSAYDIDSTDTELVFILNNIQHGQFERVNNTKTPITTFTQQDIIDQNIQFVHDGGEVAPSYEVKVNDGKSETSYVAALITFTNVNDAPKLLINQLTIFRGGHVVINNAALLATDADNNDDELLFVVKDVAYGRFEKVNNPGIAIFEFSQGEIDAGMIKFLHDGSVTLLPSYKVKVTDGQLETDWYLANIAFNPNSNNFPYGYLIGGISFGICLLCTSTTLLLVTVGAIYAKNKKAHSKKEDEIELLEASTQLGDFLTQYQVPHKDIKIIEYIGAGASATVYKAKWKNNDVAYKVFPIINSEKIKDFETEAKIMLESNHPNIVRLYRVCIKQGSFGLLMEYMEMGTLKDALSKKTVALNWGSKLNIAYDLASVLEYLHGKNVYHRDIKTDNVLLYQESDGIHAKIADFGLSRTQETKQSVTMAVGTYKYMAPEMVLGDARYGIGKFPMEKVDVYALGMTYVALITEKEPYPKEKSAMDIPARVFNKKLVQKLPKDKCPFLFFSLTNQCRNLDLEKRPPAKDIVEALNGIKKGIGRTKLSTLQLMDL